MADPYTILGVAKGCGRRRRLKAAYRKLAKELHPGQEQGQSEVGGAVQRCHARLRFVVRSRRNARNMTAAKLTRMANRADLPGVIPLVEVLAAPEVRQFRLRQQRRYRPWRHIRRSVWWRRRGGACTSRRWTTDPQQAPPPKGANIAYEHLVSFTDAATSGCTTNNAPRWQDGRVQTSQRSGCRAANPYSRQGPTRSWRQWRRHGNAEDRQASTFDPRWR